MRNSKYLVEKHGKTHVFHGWLIGILIVGRVNRKYACV